MRGLGTIRIAAGFALLLVLLGSGVARVSAGGDASITIHNRICPTDYSGSQLFADCHDNPQDSNLEFSIDAAVDETKATDDEGNVTFSGLTPGSYEVSGGVPGEFATAVVWCSSVTAPDELYQATETDTGFSIDIDASDVICDWYNIPFDLSGGDPTPTPTPDPDNDDDVTELPNTGAGSMDGANTNVVLFSLGFVALGFTALAMRRRAVR